MVAPPVMREGRRGVRREGRPCADRGRRGGHQRR